MDFVAIDFETANENRTSACALGITVIKNNKIVDTKYYLIKPEPYFFNPFNVMVHGIEEKDVENAKRFDELWEEIRPFIECNLIVAHNASFDVSVLRNTLDHYGIQCPSFEFICTLKLSQNIFPRTGSHKLNVICALMDINLNHHQAASDSSACAEILINVIEKNNVTSIKELEEKFKISTGKVCGDLYSPCFSEIYFEPCSKKAAKDFRDIKSDYIDEDFCEKNFVFTGTLLSMTRSKALEIVSLGGGIPQDNVTKKTNYLVVGLQDYRVSKDGVSGKMKKAHELMNKGQDIKIIDEDEFIKMIDDELYVKANLAQQNK